MNSKLVYEKLQDLAREATNQPLVGSKRIFISNGLLTYDFSPTPLKVLGVSPDRLTTALEILIRVTLLRRDLPAIKDAKPFWTKSLKDLESLAASLVTSAYKTSSDDQWSGEERKYQAKAEMQVADIETMLLDYARSAKLDAHRSKLDVQGTDFVARDPARGYAVTIVIDPPKARVRYMPYLEYMLCTLEGKPLEREWIDLNEGAAHLIGRYYFRAEWPPSLNGPVDSTQDIDFDGKILRFRPKSN